MDLLIDAKLRIQEAHRVAQKERLIEMAMAVKQSRGKHGQNFNTRLQSLMGWIRCYAENLYCRVLGLIYSRSSC
jgi:hypothetical protein